MSPNDYGKRIVLANSQVLKRLQAGHTMNLTARDSIDSLNGLSAGDELALWLPYKGAFIVHPVVIKKVEDQIEVAISYAFGFEEAVRMTMKGGIVRQAGWPLRMGIKWVKRPPRGKQKFIWYKINDGLPWMPGKDSVRAEDWGCYLGSGRDSGKKTK